MWNDPVVEETRSLRNEYAAVHHYDIHEIVKDLKEWEKQGFPLTANTNQSFQPTVLPSLPLRQNDG
ncbi:hypothetical protein D5085_04565 [Ectothiorhodospiraceae bacterium BW-2]|nr:hypothetical protein D5085_04565 [Ectothiorhodospiraceae bacterium BW-2]